MLSVIVPVYNTSKYLTECVMSLVNQTYKDLEIILVDDGSTDQSGKMCDELSEEYQNIRVIHKKNGGLISAWVEGTKNCNGDYVGYVDSDDWVSPDYFELLMHPIHQYDCDVSACGFTIVEKSEKIVFPAECKPGLYVGDELEKLKNNYYNNFNIENSRCIKVFNKEVVLGQINKLDYSITLCEDQVMTTRTILNAKSLFITNTFGYYYRMLDESMSHKFNIKLIENYDNVYKSVIAAFTENGYMNGYVMSNCLVSLITVIKSIVLSKESILSKRYYLRKLREYKSVHSVLDYSPKYNLNFRQLIIYKLYKYRMYIGLCLIAKMKK